MNSKSKSSAVDENTGLVSEWKKTKSKQVLEKIILNHYSMIFSIINQYRKAGLSKEDLLAEGVLGILTAIEKFDAHKEVKFTTYAYFWIKAKILKFIKTSNPFGREIKEVKKQEEIEATHEHFYEVDKVFNHVIELQSKQSKVTTLNDEMQDLYWTSFVNAKQQLEELSVQEDFSDILKVALLSLTKKEQFILESRWLMEPKATFDDLAKALGLSAERIRQKEREIFQKIRENLTSKYGSLRGEMIWLAFLRFYSKK